MSNKILIASTGMLLTNGDTYAIEVQLGDWDSPANWREITVEEAKILFPELINYEIKEDKK